jgi:hypothetical protein
VRLTPSAPHEQNAADHKPQQEHLTDDLLLDVGIEKPGVAE